MSEKLGPVQYEGNHAMFGAQSPQKMISEQTAYEIDEEVRGLLNEARNKAAEIIQGNRETHKLIAEALLKYETLDSVQIKSLYETGKMPENSEHELEEEAKPLSYDEIKSKLRRKQLILKRKENIFLLSERRQTLPAIETLLFCRLGTI